jgi:hypothetical protein
MVTNATSAPKTATNGLSSSRRVHGCLSRRRSHSVALLLVKSPQDGTLAATVFHGTSSLKLTARFSEPLFALLRHRRRQESRIPTNYTSTSTPLMLALVSVVAWVARRVLRRCSKTAAKRKTFKTKSCRRRQSTLSLEDKHN